MADDKRKNPYGPVGERAAAKIKQLREQAGLSYRELSDRLEDLGRPIPTLGLSRIENTERRIDTDDLVALALALDTTPNRLMLPDTAESEPVPLTGNYAVIESAAWAWATGQQPLWEPAWVEPHTWEGFGTAESAERWATFVRQNRPQSPEPPDSATVVHHIESLTDLIKHLHQTAAVTGVSIRDVLGVLETRVWHENNQGASDGEH